jgi:hypothetical protein
LMSSLSHTSCPTRACFQRNACSHTPTWCIVRDRVCSHAPAGRCKCGAVLHPDPSVGALASTAASYECMRTRTHTHVHTCLQAKAVGSDFLWARLRALQPHLHVFGHSHFAWDAHVQGVRRDRVWRAFARGCCARPCCGASVSLPLPAASTCTVLCGCVLQ